MGLTIEYFFLSIVGRTKPSGKYVRHFVLNPPLGGFWYKEVLLINEVVMEGIVVRDPWKFMDDLFFRLVIYRDSDLPAKKLDLECDAGDYINVRVNAGLTKNQSPTDSGLLLVAGVGFEPTTSGL